VEACRRDGSPQSEDTHAETNVNSSRHAARVAPEILHRTEGAAGRPSRVRRTHGAVRWKPILSNSRIGTLINTSFGWRVAILPPFSGRPIVQIQVRTRQSVGACIENQTAIVKKLRWRPFRPLRAGTSRLVSSSTESGLRLTIPNGLRTGSSISRVSPLLLRCLCQRQRTGARKGQAAIRSAEYCAALPSSHS